MSLAPAVPTRLVTAVSPQGPSSEPSKLCTLATSVGVPAVSTASSASQPSVSVAFAAVVDTMHASNLAASRELDTPIDESPSPYKVRKLAKVRLTFAEVVQRVIEGYTKTFVAIKIVLIKLCVLYYPELLEKLSLMLSLPTTG